VEALPIFNRFIERMGLGEDLTLALSNAGYAEAIVDLMKNVLIDRNALYVTQECAERFDAGLIAEGKISDDKLGALSTVCLLRTAPYCKPA
jgi:hypothetical protein